MQLFSPGDRVVAINTDMSRPIHAAPNVHLHSFSFPDGPLNRGVIYHVAGVHSNPDGSQGLFISGMRVLWGAQEVPWHSSRFRKVQETGHPPVRIKRKHPART